MCPSTGEELHTSGSAASGSVLSAEEAKRLAMLKFQEFTASVASSGATTHAPENGITHHSAGSSAPGTIPQFEPFFENLEINDNSSRSLITKGHFQAEIKNKSGADVTTRGRYYPDKSLATPEDPPLYLHISSASREAVDKAVSLIRESMDQQIRESASENTEMYSNQGLNKRQFHTEKVYLGFEPLKQFNVRREIIGPYGNYVKHIQNQTGVRLQLRGRGSVYPDVGPTSEDEEPLSIILTSPDHAAVEKAVVLVNSLISQIKINYEEWKKSRAGQVALGLLPPGSISVPGAPHNPNQRNRFGQPHYQVAQQQFYPQQQQMGMSMQCNYGGYNTNSLIAPIAQHPDTGVGEIPTPPAAPSDVVSSPEANANYQTLFYRFYTHFFYQQQQLKSIPSIVPASQEAAMVLGHNSDSFYHLGRMCDYFEAYYNELEKSENNLLPPASGDPAVESKSSEQNKVNEDQSVVSEVKKAEGSSLSSEPGNDELFPEKTDHQEHDEKVEKIATHGLVETENIQHDTPRTPFDDIVDEKKVQDEYFCRDPSDDVEVAKSDSPLPVRKTRAKTRTPEVKKLHVEEEVLHTENIEKTPKKEEKSELKTKSTSRRRSRFVDLSDNEEAEKPQRKTRSRRTIAKDEKEEMGYNMQYEEKALVKEKPKTRKRKTKKEKQDESADEDKVIANEDKNEEEQEFQNPEYNVVPKTRLRSKRSRA